MLPKDKSILIRNQKIFQNSKNWLLDIKKYSDSGISLREFVARVIEKIITRFPVIKAKVSALFTLGLCVAIPLPSVILIT